MIQTYAPEHPAILAAREHDFERFSATELPTRRDAGYPPYAHLIAVHADGTDAGEVASAAAVVAGAARKAAREAGAVWLLGPAEAPLQRLKGRTRWILLLKSASRQPLRRVAEAVLKVAATEVPRRVRISIDVDPVHML